MKINVLFLCIICIGCFSVTDKSELLNKIDIIELYDKPVDLNNTVVSYGRDALYIIGDSQDTTFSGYVFYFPHIINSKYIAYKYWIELYDRTPEKKYLGTDVIHFSDFLCSFDLSKESLILNHPLTYFEKEFYPENRNYKCKLSFLVELNNKESVRIRNVRLQYQSSKNKILLLPPWGFQPEHPFPLECYESVLTIIDLNNNTHKQSYYDAEDQLLNYCIRQDSSLKN